MKGLAAAPARQRGSARGAHRGHRRGPDRYRALLPEVLRLNDLLVQDLDAAEVALLRDLLTRIERRGRRMAQDNLITDKASRREGGTRRAQYG